MEHHVYSRQTLADFAGALLAAAGLRADMAATVGELLAEADEIGVSTHGVSLAAYYVPELQAGRMARDGAHTVVRDTGATLVWDGNYLPGQPVGAGRGRRARSGRPRRGSASDKRGARRGGAGRGVAAALDMRRGAGGGDARGRGEQRRRGSHCTFSCAIPRIQLAAFQIRR
ncbi:MAG TPA: Ldh family oxidoreductase [Rhizobiaceae bacterium]|nr:Ldh family oxidoreductase [Rhizobiaceae bacterium]